MSQFPLPSLSAQLQNVTPILQPNILSTPINTSYSLPTLSTTTKLPGLSTTTTISTAYTVPSLSTSINTAYTVPGLSTTTIVPSSVTTSTVPALSTTTILPLSSTTSKLPALSTAYTVPSLPTTTIVPSSSIGAASIVLPNLTAVTTMPTLPATKIASRSSPTAPSGIPSNLPDLTSGTVFPALSTGVALPGLSGGTFLPGLSSGVGLPSLSSGTVLPGLSTRAALSQRASSPILASSQASTESMESIRQLPETSRIRSRPGSNRSYIITSDRRIILPGFSPNNSRVISRERSTQSGQSGQFGQPGQPGQFMESIQRGSMISGQYPLRSPSELTGELEQYNETFSTQIQNIITPGSSVGMSRSLRMGPVGEEQLIQPQNRDDILYQQGKLIDISRLSPSASSDIRAQSKKAQLAGMKTSIRSGQSLDEYYQAEQVRSEISPYSREEMVLIARKLGLQIGTSKQIYENIIETLLTLEVITPRDYLDLYLKENELSKLSPSQLRSLLRILGLQTTGIKNELVKRIERVYR